MAKSNQQSFWKSFAKNSWEKKPLLAKKFDSPLAKIKAEHIFDMLVEYGDHCRKVQKADGFKLYIDGQIQYDDETLQLLPEKKDKTLQGYHYRMEEMFEDYCLVCDELLQVSQKHLQKLHAFSDHLFSHVGFPNRFAEIGLYLGNYRQTPFGVHVDGCGVFSFPVVGKKTFRLWKPEFATKHPALDRAHEYSKFKKNSETMIATAGDMTYWPSSAWHIAESDGSFNATWSLGVWVDRTHHQNLEIALNPLLKAKLGLLGTQKVTMRKTPSELPSNYLKSISVLKNISENEWHDTLLKSWLELSSKNGFKNFPQNKSQPKLSMQSLIELSSSSPILCSNLKSKAHVYYAFQRNAIEAVKSASLLKLIQDLNTGKACLISDYLKKPHDMKSMQALANQGAVGLVTALTDRRRA
jgi:Cupin superfamily protein